MDDDDVLVGGLNTVRRVGPHVIRPAGPPSASVHRLLRYDRANGFLEAAADIAYLREHETLFAGRTKPVDLHLSRSVGLLAIPGALN